MPTPGPTSLRSPGVDRCLSDGQPVDSWASWESDSGLGIARWSTSENLNGADAQNARHALHPKQNKPWDKPSDKPFQSLEFLDLKTGMTPCAGVPDLFQDSVFSSSKACETWRMSIRWVIVTEHVTCCMGRYCQCIPMPLLSRFVCGLQALLAIICFRNPSYHPQQMLCLWKSSSPKQLAFCCIPSLFQHLMDTLWQKEETFD